MRKLVFMLSVLVCSMQLIAQHKTVTGKVTDEKDGSPLGGVSVLVKGTNVGTNTKSDGTFSLSLPVNAKVLVFSYVNMTTEELTIGNQSVFNVRMSSQASSLETIVVTVPYGTVKKKAFTGAENTITSEALQKQQVTSVSKALDGIVPGVISTNGGGQPGSGAAIRIRGIGSVNATSAPLYVLNGIPYDGSIEAIPTEDIETVTVLKDAAAAALYGSRAANGVIMITTKKGKKGTPKLTFNASQGFMDRLIPEYNRVGPKEYYELFWEAYRNNYVAQGNTPAQAGVNASNVLTSSNGLVYNAYNVPGASLVDPVTGKLNSNASLLWNESWEDAMFRVAKRSRASMSVSGGSEGADFYISAGYLNEEGIVKYSGYERYNARMNVNATPTKWFNTGIAVDGAFINNRFVPSGGSSTTNPFYYTRQMGPIYPVYQHNLTTGALVKDSLGNPVFDFGTPTQMGTRPYAGRSNDAATLALDNRSSKDFNGTGNIYGEIKFTKELSLKGTLGTTIYNSNGTSYQNNQYGDAAPSTPGGTDGGRSTKTNGRTFSLTGNEVLSYTKDFEKHNIRALVGHENYLYKYNYLAGYKSGFIFPGYTELDNGASSTSPATSYEDNLRIESYFANINYDFDSRYLLSASYRTDGSSRFSPQTRWGTFYSVGAGWRVLGEKFMQNVKWLSELKLRGSYGEQGNEGLYDANGSPLYYSYKDYYYSNGTGGYTPPSPSRVANPDLQWETNSVLNLGVDFGLMNNRLTGTFEWFNRKSANLLFDVPLPISTGTASVYQNIGAMKNVGVELQLGYLAIKQHDFRWKVDVNLTHFKNTITKLPPKQEKNGIISGTKKLLVGGSIYDFWLPEFAGVDASTGDALYYMDIKDADGKVTSSVITSQYSQASSSLHKFGSALPKVAGGLNNTFSYKGFDLSILTTFSYGGKFYDGNYAGIMHRGSPGTSWSTDILKRWQKPGDVTNVPRLQYSVANNDGASSRWLIDGSWLNIKNVTLSYNFSKNLNNLLNLSGGQFFVSVDNAYLWTAKKGSDPQRSFAGTADATYTPFRTMTLGATVNFK